MSRRWTNAQIRDFETDWLSEAHRCGHQWREGIPRCVACGRKFGRNAGKLCPKRKHPNRWRLHMRRAMLAAQYRPEIPTINAQWVLEQLAEIRSTLRVHKNIDDRFWKYHRLARRHRRLMKLWWTFPGTPVTDAGSVREHDHGIARARNKLIRQVRAAGTPIVKVGGCTYTFYPHATMVENGVRVNLFGE